jgi:hypothetical protein
VEDQAPGIASFSSAAPLVNRARNLSSGGFVLMS